MDLAFVDSTEHEQVFNNEIKTRLVSPSLHKYMCLRLLSEKAPRGSILINGAPPISDHSVFAFWVVAYKGLDCIFVSTKRSCVSKTQTVDLHVTIK